MYLDCFCLCAPLGPNAKLANNDVIVRVRRIIRTVNIVCLCFLHFFCSHSLRPPLSPVLRATCRCKRCLLVLAVFVSNPFFTFSCFVFAFFPNFGPIFFSRLGFSTRTSRCSSTLALTRCACRSAPTRGWRTNSTCSTSISWAGPFPRAVVCSSSLFQPPFLFLLAFVVSWLVLFHPFEPFLWHFSICRK